MPRELFVSDELVVRESQELDGGAGVSYAGRLGVFPAHAPHVVVTPPKGVYGRLSRADVEQLHEALGRWLGR